MEKLPNEIVSRLIDFIHWNDLTEFHLVCRLFRDLSQKKHQRMMRFFRFVQTKIELQQKIKLNLNIRQKIIEIPDIIIPVLMRVERRPRRMLCFWTIHPATTYEWQLLIDDQGRVSFYSYVQLR